MNRLASEKSPYLLQHAQNPVHWFAWSDEAFAKARSENKPVFLSIGYSTCHWCHVMAKESFENSEIAGVLNQHFVSIKVDREERPDIDQVYMASVTAMTGQGGWPLTVFLTPDKMPFYGGTYFPPYPKWGAVGFRDLLGSIAHSWQTNQQDVIRSSRELAGLLKERFTVSQTGETLTVSDLDRMFERLSSQFDRTYGGFGHAPKFPMGHQYSLLLRYWQRTGEPEALEMTTQTLRSLALGGIFDQLGGGFHRYSTDRIWQVPHFEKMLYDQALLVRVYCEAFQATKDEFFADIARKVLDYVLREMTDLLGGFYCAQDADSVDENGHKKEGAFYVWGTDEVGRALSPVQAEVASFYYGLTPNGNAKEDPHGEFTGKNILHVTHSIEETAGQFKMEPNSVQEMIHQANQKLFEKRRFRTPPHLDDKVMADWNGLMISAFAFASQVLQEDRYGSAAIKAADFILKAMVRPDGRLMHRYRDGETAVLGTLEDYAFFVWGLLDIYEMGGDVRYIKAAKNFTDQMMDLFEDKEAGGFYLTGRDAGDLFVRPKESYDGALPSGNSVALLNMLRLHHFTSNDRYKDAAQKAIGCFAKQAHTHPDAYSFLLAAFDFGLGPVDEIVLSGNQNNSPYQEMRRMIYNQFRPNKVLAVLPSEANTREAAGETVPLVAEKMTIVDSLPCFYFCRDKACLQPAKDVSEWQNILDSNQPSRRKPG